MRRKTAVGQLQALSLSTVKRAYRAQHRISSSQIWAGGPPSSESEPATAARERTAVYLKVSGGHGHLSNGCVQPWSGSGSNVFYLTSILMNKVAKDIQAFQEDVLVEILYARQYTSTVKWGNNC